MGRKLEQIVRSSYTGYIDSMTEVAKIVTKFINQSLAELLDTVDMKTKETIETLAGCLLTEDWDLSKESVESLKYTDLLCLIDNTRIYPSEDDYNERPLYYYSIDAEIPKPPFRYLGIGDICILLKNAEKTSNTVKLFLSVNVNSLFAYLKSISNEGVYINVWTTLLERAEALGIDIGADTSIRDILNQAEVSWVTWKPWKAIRDYYNKVLFVFDLYSCLLIDCFRYAYPERFRLNNIIDQYSHDKADN